MLIFFLGSLAKSSTIFTSEDVGCYEVQISDGTCNEECMMQISNFDSSIESEDLIEIFKGSDCFERCLKAGCTIQMLSSPTCSEACNRIECGWGLGKCGFCAPGCTYEMLTNSQKDIECNEIKCKFDNGQFGWCAPGCFKEDLQEGSAFKHECNNTSCYMQNGIGMPQECSPGCDFELISVPVCWFACDTPQCEYALGKCFCDPRCDNRQLLSEGCEKDDPCNNKKCFWKNGKCPPKCSSNCFNHMIGNGVCEKSCFNEECNWDGSDCSCAVGCPSYWDGNSWNHTGGCLEACLVETCQFNYKNCTLKGILTNAILSSMFYTSEMMNNYLNCSCSDSELLSFSADSTCSKSNACFNFNCSYCIGFSNQKKIPSCLRYHDDGCLIKNGSIIYRGQTVSQDLVDSLEDVIETINELNELISGSTHYFLKAGGYIREFVNITIDALDEFYTFADALADCIFPYCAIKLGPGKFHFKPVQEIRSYMYHEYDPMLFVVNLYQKELHIEGSGKDTVIFFYAYMVFHSFYEKLFIKNLTFSGQYLLYPDCDVEGCMYCQAFFKLESGFFKDDRNRIVTDQTFVNLCKDLTVEVPFELESITQITDVNFINFRNNPESLINAKNSLSISSSSFSKIQCKESCIIVECLKDCWEIEVTIQDTVVTDLNPGYEHTDSLALGGFLKASKIGAVKLLNVSFTFNVAISSLKLPKSALLQIFNIQEQVLINECRFQNIYTDYLLLVDVTNIEFENFSIDKYLIRNEYKKFYLKIYNSQFHNIFSRSNLVKVEMSSNRPNIDIKKCDFYDIVATGNGMFSFESDSEISEVEIQADIVTELIKNKKEKFIYFDKHLILEEVTIKSTTVVGNIININYYPNVSLKQIYLESISNADTTDVYEKVIIKFIESGKYLSQQPKDSEIPLGNFDFLMKLKNIVNLEKEFVNFHFISSFSRDFSLINIESSTKVKLLSIIMKNIIVNSYIPCLLNFKSVWIISLAEINVSSVTNEKEMMSFIDCEYISISVLHQINTQNRYAPSISINNPKELTLENLFFSSCLFLNSRGGIFSISFNQPSKLTIIALKMIGVRNLQGKACFLYLDSQKSSSLIDLFMSNINITESFSYFCFLIITSDVKLNVTEIYELTLLNSSSSLTPIIFDEHQGSQIFFKGIKAEMIMNSSHFYNGNFITNEVSVTMINADFINCNFFQDIVSIKNIVSITFFIAIRFRVIDSMAENALSLSSIYCSLFHSSFDHFSGLAVYAEDSVIKAENFTLNMVKGGGFQLKSVILNCNDCIMSNTNSTFVTFSDNSTVFFVRSFFLNSFTVKPSIVDCASSVGMSIFDNCRFENSFSYNQSAFLLSKCSVSITNSFFSDITSNSYVITLNSNSWCVLNNNQFFYNISKIFFITQSWLSILGSTFTGNKSYLEGLGLSFNGSELESNTKILKEMMKNENQFELIFSYKSLVLISNSSFFNTLGKKSSVIYSQHGIISIERVKINNFFTSEEGSSAIYIEISNFEANYLEIKTSLTFSSGIGFWYQIPYQVIKISYSNFSEIHSVIGAGVIFISPIGYSRALIFSSIFENNSATSKGGAIYAENYFLVINNTRIANNSAVISGGGAYYSSIDCEICKFFLVNHSEVVFNSCPEGEGGGIKWDKKPNISDSIIESNYAKHGNDFASYPSKLVFISFSRDLLENNSSRLTLSPGQNYSDSIQVCMQDSYSNNYSQDSTSTAILEKGLSDGKISVLGTTEFKSNEGCFSITGFKVMGPPDSFSSLSLKTTAIDEENQLKSGDDQNYSSTLEIPIYFRDCLKGERKSESSCIECTEGQYLFDPEPSCKDCLSNADCPGKDLLLPKSGYWKVSKYTETLYPCLIAEACLGHLNETDYSGTCALGYRGHLCSSCEFGYSLSSSGKCSKCPSKGLNILVLMSLLTGIITVCAILVRSTLKSAFSPQNIQSVYIKIFTNYLQIVFLTTQFNLNWPSIVLNMFSVQKTAATAPDQIFSIDCYMTSQSVNNEEQYFTKLILFATLPGAIFAFCFNFWFFFSLVKENYQSLKRELFTSMIVLFFLVHPNLTKVFFSSFSCKHLETIGYWLNDNLEVKCYTKTHYKILSTISGPSIILWVLGSPALLLVILIKKRNFLHLDNYKVIFGFLYNGYKNSKFYWEFIILYRKIVIISIIIFMSSSTEAIQALTVNFFLILSIYLQFKHHPFSASSLNKLEMEALITATLTIYSGLYYLTDDLNEISKFVLFGIILLGNSYFLVFWIWYNFKALIDTLVFLLPFLKRICKKGDSLRIDFYEKNIQPSGVFSGTQTGEKIYSFRQNFHKSLSEKLKGIKSMEMLYIGHMKSKDSKSSVENKQSIDPDNSHGRDYNDFI